MKVLKEVGSVVLLILLVTWYVGLGYVMVNYVNEINKIDSCKNLAPWEGGVIKTYGLFKLAIIGFLMFFGVFTIISSLM